jgi:glutamate N-acetyltransferase/amino-acid N-acetyltransferase
MARSGVTVPTGFTAAGVACGLKKNGNPDLAVVFSQVPATAAGVFTTNVVKGHSLQWSREHIRAGVARIVAINSGCANACVGEDGKRDAAAFAGLVAERAVCPVEQVMIGSTGVIGFRLDMDKIRAGLDAAFDRLSPEGGIEAAVAVMTTDTFKKEAESAFELNGKIIRIGGFAKGSGMIHPNMATMISILTTDLAISAPLLDKALRTVVNRSYNRVSVDGDTSVCDKVLILANGMAGNEPVQAEGDAYDSFVSALDEVASSLAKMLARDGEGATKLLEFHVDNAPNQETAHTILQAVVKSPLVKTAFFGEDANWGRILTAAGYSGASFDPDRIDIRLGDVLVCQNGTALRFDEQAALKILKAHDIVVTIDMKSGTASDRMWTCDFSYDYVKINGSYRT